MIGVRVGVRVGARVGVAVGASSDELGDSVNVKNLFAAVGDSNMVGQGPGNGCDTGFLVQTPNTGVQLNSRYANGVSGPTFIDYPAFRAFTPLSLYADPNLPSMGIEITFGAMLQARSVPSPGIAKFCVTGSTLAVEWLPTGTYPAAGAGNLFNLMVAQMQSFVASTGAPLRGIVVSLGTNDAASNGQATAFQANMGAFCTALRAVFPGLVIAWIKTNPDPLGNAFFATVISGQVAYVATDPLCVLVDNADCVLVSDHLHYTPNSYLTLGQRCGATLCDQIGFPIPAVVGAPRVIGYGPANGSTTNPLSLSYGDEKDGQLQILSVRTGNVAPGAVTPSGTWTTIGTVTSSFAGTFTTLHLFSRPVTAALLAANNGHMPPVTVTVTTATVNEAKIYTIKGPNLNPTVEVSAFTQSNTFSTGPNTVPAITTLSANDLVLLFAGGFCGASGTQTETNATLAGFTKIQDSAIVIVTDRQLECLAGGSLAAAGTSGTFSASSSNNIVPAYAVLGIKP